MKGGEDSLGGEYRSGGTLLRLRMSYPMKENHQERNIFGAEVEGESHVL
jgi:hypothetical protein